MTNPSRGNLSTGPGFQEREAEHLRIRSTLMSELRKLMKERDLTPEEAARLFGVTQPRILNLVHGRIELFAIDHLVDMMAAAGIQVDVVFSTLQPGVA